MKITSNKEDIKYMKQAFKIAEKHPDKRRKKAIGAIIVKNKKIISEGYRYSNNIDGKIITYHAEHMAILKAENQTKNSTLYTTLEPCTKRFKADYCITPEPCCKLINEANIKRVVIADVDKNFGAGGIEYLLKHNIEVAICPVFNKNFNKNLVQDNYFPDEKQRKRYNASAH